MRAGAVGHGRLGGRDRTTLRRPQLTSRRPPRVAWPTPTDARIWRTVADSIKRRAKEGAFEQERRSRTWASRRSRGSWRTGTGSVVDEDMEDKMIAEIEAGAEEEFGRVEEDQFGGWAWHDVRGKKLGIGKEREARREEVEHVVRKGV